MVFRESMFSCGHVVDSGVLDSRPMSNVLVCLMLVELVDGGIPVDVMQLPDGRDLDVVLRTDSLDLGCGLLDRPHAVDRHGGG